MLAYNDSYRVTLEITAPEPDDSCHRGGCSVPPIGILYSPGGFPHAYCEEDLGDQLAFQIEWAMEQATQRRVIELGRVLAENGWHEATNQPARTWTAPSSTSSSGCSQAEESIAPDPRGPEGDGETLYLPSDAPSISGLPPKVAS